MAKGFDTLIIARKVYIKVSKLRDKTAIRSMDDLSRKKQRIFDKEKSNITK